LVATLKAPTIQTSILIRHFPSLHLAAVLLPTLHSPETSELAATCCSTQLQRKYFINHLPIFSFPSFGEQGNPKPAFDAADSDQTSPVSAGLVLCIYLIDTSSQTKLSYHGKEGQHHAPHPSGRLPRQVQCHPCLNICGIAMGLLQFLFQLYLQSKSSLVLC
jgi:hypothetical protein